MAGTSALHAFLPPSSSRDSAEAVRLVGRRRRQARTQCKATKRMQLSISNSAEFEKLLDGLGRDVVDASIHLQLHSRLRDSVKAFDTELNQSPAFWTLTFGAHGDAFRARLFRAYDSHPSSLSLLNLIDTVITNIHLFGVQRAASVPTIVVADAPPPDPHVLQCYRALVDPNDPLVKKLLGQRNNVFAHRNATNVVQELMLEHRFALTFSEVTTLVDRAVEIVNTYSSLFRHSTWSTRMVGEEDFRDLLLAVRRDMQHREAEVQRQIDQSLSEQLPPIGSSAVSTPRDPWKIEVGDRLCAVVDMLIGLSTGALVLPALFLRTFLAVPEGKPLMPCLTLPAYVAIGAFGFSILLGLVFRYTSAKWVKDAWGQEVKLSSNALEHVLNWSFWLTVCAFGLGLLAFLTFAGGRRIC